VLEREYQSILIKKLRNVFPGSFIMKTNGLYFPSFPDLLILHKDKWACLEIKRDEKSYFRPNQLETIKTLDDLSFARVIFPKNELEVLKELNNFFNEGGKQ